MKSFTWDCFSFSQAAKHFNKLGKWDCKTTTSNSKPQGQEPFLKLILTQVLTLIRFQEENVPLSCFSVLGEALVSYVDSEKQFSSQCIAVTGISGPFCHSFLYSPRDALPRHLISSVFLCERMFSTEVALLLYQSLILNDPHAATQGPKPLNSHTESTAPIQNSWGQDPTKASRFFTGKWVCCTSLFFSGTQITSCFDWQWNIYR